MLGVGRLLLMLLCFGVCVDDGLAGAGCGMFAGVFWELVVGFMIVVDSGFVW